MALGLDGKAGETIQNNIISISSLLYLIMCVTNQLCITQASFNVDLIIHDLINILEQKHVPIISHSQGSWIISIVDSHDMESIKMGLDVAYKYI